MRMRVIAGAAFGLLAAVVVACTDEASPATPSSPADAGTADADAGPSCVVPSDAPVWLDAYLRDELAALTGDADTAGGIRLTDRATPERRKAAAEHLVAELGGLGIDAASESYGEGANVVGRILATNAETSEWVVIGAHYDSVTASPGANDNASGVAAVLAVARMLTELPCRRRGVIVAFFDQEEIGLVGSKALAAKLADEGTAIVAVHTVDQVGWDADDDLRFELEVPTSELLAEYQSSAEVVGATVVKTSTDTSDHQSFRAKGFAAVGITEEYVNRDTSLQAHKAGDSASTIDATYHALAARLVGHVVSREVSPE